MKLSQDHDFSVFYKNYKDSIYKVIRFLSSDPEEVEDVAQEVFLNLYKSFSNFSPEKGSFYTWAATVAKNTFYTYRKKQKKDMIVEGDAVFIESLQVEDNFIQNIESKIVEEELREIISSLPEPEKSIILLKEINNYTLEKTSQALNISSRTVSRRLLKALDLLREELERRKVVL
ncbi:MULTISPECIES: RNA polymerase sigma factor [Leptospira]|uniref:Sigma-70 family RNA polymerase sigma factor n=2 Tax=Leptospira interrogans TaxID=173 RepID=A0AAV9FT55_LEPIR|nr:MULTISPECIES: sigma-70 family RNA polymerase sigma factor [Leptospira]EJP18112.1 sigma-70 region 2 [Leptospira interrogans str. FPW2026]EKO26872.1 sigma-70 region 2 [Leptospira interrogans str. UI 12621]EMJ47230.1 sigma-70 region 2 [Leptospira interrogans str. UT126]EMN55404.1 sigma-70 region 2 [Leptospira interrogans serovar Autumnalis str. LP101]KAK2620674.1 sigma-70 family RNA polymerase sigma factor [Leptospira interrogans]